MSRPSTETGCSSRASIFASTFRFRLPPMSLPTRAAPRSARLGKCESGSLLHPLEGQDYQRGATAGGEHCRSRLDRLYLPVEADLQRVSVQHIDAFHRAQALAGQVDAPGGCLGVDRKRHPLGLLARLGMDHQQLVPLKYEVLPIVTPILNVSVLLAPDRLPLALELRQFLLRVTRVSARNQAEQDRQQDDNSMHRPLPLR